MKQTTFYTESKKQGYDIIYVDSRQKSYSLYLNYKDYDVDLYGEEPKHISRDEFDKLLNSYEKYEEFDLTGYDPNSYERFYRDCHNSEDNVDLIEINAVKKEYALSLDVDEMNTDGYDLIGNPICSTYVSKTVFDVIVAGVKANGFKEVEAFNDAF